jgi:hypothetical protein
MITRITWHNGQISGYVRISKNPRSTQPYWRFFLNYEWIEETERCVFVIPLAFGWFCIRCWARRPNSLMRFPHFHSFPLGKCDNRPTLKWTMTVSFIIFATSECHKHPPIPYYVTKCRESIFKCTHNKQHQCEKKKYTTILQWLAWSDIIDRVEHCI